MFLILALGCLIALCALVWNCAVFALPLFAGLSVGFWFLNHGAGMSAAIIGLVASAIVHGAVCYGVQSTHAPVRWLAVVMFVVPAAMAGYGIPQELMASATWLWREAVSVLGSLCVAGTAYRRVSATEP